MSIKVSKILTSFSMSQKRALYTGDLQWEMIKTGAWQCCLNCTHYNSTKAVCSLHGNQTPPPHIIAVGCKDYGDEDDIPF